MGSSNQLQQVQALLALHIRSGKAKRALRLLDNKKAIFEKAGVLGLWTYWRGQALVANGQARKAIEELEKEADPTIRFRVKALALHEICKQTGDWQPLIEHLEQPVDTVSEGEALLELCEVKANLKDWDYVADRAEQLCELVSTSAVVRFAVGAVWNAGRPTQCLQILDTYLSLFPGSQLPAELSRLRIQCLLKTDLLKAQAEAERLVQRDPSTENIVSLIDVQLTKMDSTGAIHAARMLRRREDVTPAQLLRAARLVMLDDVDLAKEFWRGAKDAALNDPELASEALNLAFMLGLDREAAPLLGRLQEFASQGEGPVQVFNIDSVLEMMKERTEHLERIYGLYRSAEAPLHLIAEQVKRPLADIIHGQSELNRAATDLYRQPHIYIRHGARLIPPVTAEDTHAWRLHLDVTALLIAEELGILDKVEHCFKPLYISAEMSAALRSQRLSLVPHQQSQITSDEIILQLISESKLHVVDQETSNRYLAEFDKYFSSTKAHEFGGPDSNVRNTNSHIDEAQLTSKAETQGADLSTDMGEGPLPEQLAVQLRTDRLVVIAAAVAEDGFAVDFLPLTSHGKESHLVELPQSLIGRVINCRAVVDSLQNHELVSDDTVTQSVRALGTEANPDVYSVVPLVASKLFLGKGIADVLANAGLLNIICEHFQTAVMADCVQEARSNLAEHERRARTLAWVENILNHLRLGIEDQTYRPIHISDNKLRETKESEVQGNHDFMTSLDLMLYDPRPGDILWIDDRFYNKFPMRDGAPLIGISEVLLALHLRNEIDKHEYYRLLLQLRAGNFRFIPIDKEEILYHLSHAQVVDGNLIETTQLSTLRRYLAACLLDEQALQSPPADENIPNSMGEMPFVLSATFAVMDAVVLTWANESIDKDTAMARADWLLSNLYTGTLGNRHLLNRQGIEWAKDDLYLTGTDIAALFSKGINIRVDLLKGRSESQRRKEYFSWLDDRISARRFKADPQTAATVARRLEEIFRGAPQQDYPSRAMETASRLLLQGLFVDLPESIKDKMNLDPQVMRWLSLELTSAAAIGSSSFPVSEFWEAAEKALRGDVATIKASGTDDEFKFSRSVDGAEEKSGWITIDVVNARGESVGQVRDTLLGLLLPDVQMREETLERHRQILDLDRPLFEREKEEIARTENTRARIERARGWMQQSSEVFYQELDRHIRNKRAFLWAELTPPSGAGLLRHFRLPQSLEPGHFLEIWDESVRSLLQDVDLEIALERCASLPVAMPNSVLVRLMDIPVSDLKELLTSIAQRWISPLHQLHLANIVLRMATPEGEYAEIARNTLASLYSEEGAQRFTAFKAILNFVKDEFVLWPEASSWSQSIKLAMIWAHTCRLQQIFHSTGATAADLISIFQDSSRHISSETLERDYIFWNDCLHPRRLNRVEFLTHGAAALFHGIDEHVLEATGAARLINDMVFDEHESGTKFPNVHLINDITLALNSLNSILGGDRAARLIPITQDEAIQVLSSDNLHKLTEQSLHELLLDQTKIGPWAQLLAILVDLPIYPDLQEQCITLLRNLDPIAVFDKNPTAARLAMHFAANQALYLGDENIRARFQRLVLDLIQLEIQHHSQKKPNERMGQTVADDEDNIQLTNDISHLIDTALIVSTIPGDAAATSRIFSAFLQRVLEIWPIFSDRLGYALSKLVFELPVRQLEGWWSLLLRIRSSRRHAL